MDHVLAASRGGKWEWENLVSPFGSQIILSASRLGHITLHKTTSNGFVIQRLQASITDLHRIHQAASNTRLSSYHLFLCPELVLLIRGDPFVVVAYMYTYTNKCIAFCR
jgi:hypothetical protein